MEVAMKQCRKFSFTKGKIDTLPPNPQESRAREQEYSDMQVIGLRLLVSKNGRKFFHLRYSFNQRRRIISIGEYPALSVSDARNRANDFKKMIAFGLDPQQEKHKQTASITFREFIEKEYLPFARQSKKSWKDDVLKLEKDMYPVLGNLALTAITTRDVQRYLTNIKTRVAAATCNRHYALLSRMFNLGIQWGFIEKNPCQGIQKLKEAGGKERYLSDDEVKRLLSALDNVDPSPSAYAVKFLLFTGMRMSEALTMQWKNVNLEGASVFLPETKAGKARTVVLNGLAKGILVDIKNQGWSRGYVFPGKERKGHLTSPKRVFEAVKKMAGIENLRIHDLRHTFASIAVNSGSTLYEVQKLLGHHSSTMTQRYAHLGDSQLRAATDSVAEQIGQAVG